MTFLGFATGFCAVVVLLALILSSVRVVRGPHIADRLIALDVVCLLGVAACGLAALVSGAFAFVDIALALGMIGFLATVAFAAFIERGAIGEGDSPTDEEEQKS